MISRLKKDTEDFYSPVYYYFWQLESNECSWVYSQSILIDIYISFIYLSLQEAELLGKLMEYLDKSSPSQPSPPLKGQDISVERVHSRTTQLDVKLQKKAMEQVEEVEGWVEAAALAPSSVLQMGITPDRENVKVQDLQLDVQSNSNNDVYGYIITDTE